MMSRRGRGKRGSDEPGFSALSAKRNRTDQEVPRDDASASSTTSGGEGSGAGGGYSRRKINDVVVNIPRYGTPVERNRVRTAGPFVIGHELGTSPGVPQTQYLARKENTDDFFLLKILSYDTESEVYNKETQQGKILLHTEYTLLSLLADLEGVIHHHGLFCDFALEEKQIENADRTVQSIYTGRVKKRLILVLDCVHAHEFCEQSASFVNLQKYVQTHKFSEIEALTVFYEIVKVVEELHHRNIIHRDLKLNNIVLNRRTNKIVITNFFLAKHLNSEDDYLYDQRGSPAYISPDVLGGKPYKGKPSDVWALGVILFTIIYGKFPFLDTTPSALFKKIRQADYHIPVETKISHPTIQLIKSMLTLNPTERYTATDVRMELERSIASLRGPRIEIDQIVPEMEDFEQASKDASKAGSSKDGKTTYPSHELSSEAFSRVLESGVHRREHESFLRPRSLVNRVGGIRHNPLILRAFTTGQNRMIVYGNSLYAATNSTGRNRPNEGANANGAFVVRTPRPEIMQVRHAAPVSVENFAVSLAHHIAQPTQIQQQQQQHFPPQQAVPVPQPQQMPSNIYISVDPQNMNQGVNLPGSNSITIPLLSTPSATISNSPAFQNADVQSLYQSMNNMFARGHIPPPSREESPPFHGIITLEIANKIVTWLLANFSNHTIVQEIFSNAANNKVNSVLELLRRCGVQMDPRGGNPLIKVEQSFDVLMFMTYLLQVAGLNNNYFLNSF